MPDPSSSTPVEDDEPHVPPRSDTASRPAPAGPGTDDAVEVTAEPASAEQEGTSATPVTTEASAAEDGGPPAGHAAATPYLGDGTGPIEVDDDADTTAPTRRANAATPAKAGTDQPVTAAEAPDRVDAAEPPTDTPSAADGDEAVSDPEPDEAGQRRRSKKVEIDLRFLVATLLVVALAAGAYGFGTYQGNKGKAAVDGPNGTGTTVFKPPKEFVPLADPATGVKLSVPKDWVRYSTKDLPDKALRLSVGIPNTGDTVVVRVNPYSTEITEANLGDQKNLFDELLGGEKIQIFVNQPTKLAGLPALFYVYRFTDEATGTAGIHAHYFVFQGRKMVSLIFQALPESRYETLAPTFDMIANSLEVAPGPPPDFLQPVNPGSSPATTTAPGSTSAPAPPTTG